MTGLTTGHFFNGFFLKITVMLNEQKSIFFMIFKHSIIQKCFKTQ